MQMIIRIVFSIYYHLLIFTNLIDKVNIICAKLRLCNYYVTLSQFKSALILHKFYKLSVYISYNLVYNTILTNYEKELFYGKGPKKDG